MSETIRYVILPNQKYDGSLIHQRFAYKHFNRDVSPYGNLVIFIGEMEVTDNLIDLEDKMTNDFIFSARAVNMCWEIPNMCALGAVAFQRLFNREITDILTGFLTSAHEDIYYVTEGDDIFIKHTKFSKKCSVSITGIKDGAALGHTGLNLEAGPKAPDFAGNIKVDECDVDILMSRIGVVFEEVTKSLFTATTKVVF